MAPSEDEGAGRRNHSFLVLSETELLTLGKQWLNLSKCVDL